MRYREYKPPLCLAEWTECFWTGEVDQPVFAAPVRPDACIDIVYSRREGLRAVGTMTSTQRYDHTSDNFHCGVRFLPGMAREFLKIPSGELTDQSVPLPSPLARRLEDTMSAAEAVRVLAVNLPRPQSGRNPVQRAIAALTQTHGRADLDRLASDANLSLRHFRRLCVDESGLTPKHLSRVLRFRKALELSRCAAPDWAQISLAAGYFDQSHLIRDFREFTGETPMSVFSNRPAADFA